MQQLIEYFYLHLFVPNLQKYYSSYLNISQSQRTHSFSSHEYELNSGDATK
jgi:hypothetical protein